MSLYVYVENEVEETRVAKMIPAYFLTVANILESMHSMHIAEYLIIDPVTVKSQIIAAATNLFDCLLVRL